MAAGYDDTTIEQQGYLNKIESTVQAHTVFANKDLFPQAGPASSPGSSKISWLIEYLNTNNGGLMTDYTDVAPSSDELADVEAYQNKDTFQNLAQTYDILVNRMETNYNGLKVPGTSQEARAFAASAKNMASDIAEAMASDLKTMIDDSGNFSDAAISRSTYYLASVEQSTVGTLALSDIDTLISSLETKEYGRATRDQLFFLMSNVNQRRVANLSTKVQYAEYNASSDGMGDIDGGIAHRVKAYDEIPIYIENSLGDADILLIRRGAVAIYDHWAPSIKDLNVAAWQKKMLMGQGSNIVVTNPRYCGKASGITG